MMRVDNFNLVSFRTIANLIVDLLNMFVDLAPSCLTVPITFSRIPALPCYLERNR